MLFFVFKITLSIALWKFILILALLCFFATSFGLWSNVLSKSLEESMMFGNMFAIIGTIVSGGITQVTNNEIFNYVVQFFPQKQVMTTLSALENKKRFTDFRNNLFPFTFTCFNYISNCY